MRVIPDPRDSGTKRERTRNRLLTATQELLLERSAGSLTIRDVSHQAELSRREQASIDSTDADVATRLAAGNRAYEQRFDRVFLIRAAGRSARSRSSRT